MRQGGGLRGRRASSSGRARFAPTCYLARLQLQRLPLLPLLLLLLLSLLLLDAALTLPRPARASLLTPGGARTAPHFDADGFVDASAYVALDKLGKGVQPVKLADLNGDQYLDVLGLRGDSGELVAIYWDHNTYNFSSLTTVVESGVRHAVTADFNADGVEDVLAFSDGAAKVFLGQRDNSFRGGSTLPAYPGWDNISDVSVFDHDGTLLPDVLLTPALDASSNNASVTLYINRKDDFGVFDKRQFTPDDCALSTGLPVGFVDINGDCLPDLVLPCAAAGGGGGGATFKVWYSKGERGSDMLQSTAASASWTPAGDSRELKWVVYGDYTASGTVSILALDSAGKLLYIRNEHATGGYNHQCRAASSVELKGAEEVIVGGGDAFALEASARLYPIDYDYDGRIDLFVVTASQRRMLRNTLSDGTLSFEAQSSSSGQFESLYSVAIASAAAAYNTDQDGRQDLLLGTDSGAALWYNNIEQERQFFVTSILDAAKFRSDPYPFADSAGSTSLVVFDGKQGKEAHACSQCPASGSSRFVEACQCTVGLNNMLNYVEELAAGAGSSQRSYTNLLPNSFAVVYPQDPGDSGAWRLELYTQRHIGSIIGVIIVLSCSIVVLGAAIVFLMWREHKEDKKQRYARDHIFSFSSF